MSTKTIRFHAGKVQYDEETNRCTPLAHKGVIVVKPSADEPDFFDFTWTAKSDFTVAGNVEKDELLLIPGDVSFKHIKSCTSGRVFALTFLSSGAKYLYWLQDVGDIDQLDKVTEKDLQIVKEINDLITIKEDDEELEEEDEEPQAAEASKEVKEEHQDNKEEPVKETPKLPISAISDLLDIGVIEKHLDKLNPEQLQQLYSEHLPQSSASHPSKSTILDVVRSGFFQQSEQNLSKSLRDGKGAGYLLAQSLKYDYKGEGVDGFLAGIRELAKKEQEEAKSSEAKQVEEGEENDGQHDEEMKD
ncbi:proteasome complex subunit Rpn13 ubiquitin receptor-domain-containing protein [Scheffersomyces xylosifermentans]|uniref:proteasome complex subunit Rpn13 ubiquitin receptor-domain-containing protein n=1 Tax=Scheffersomyces xylosifermentans TaxID=1304137 RepID=UPI00315D18D8